jgi:signal transduction histidine kinase
MIYNFAIYFYTKDKQNLYYGIAQLSVLLFLLTLEGLYLSPFVEVYNFQSLRLHSFFQVSLLIFSMLFIREFLHTNEIKQLDRLIKVIIILSLIDIPILLFTEQNVITSLIPIFVFIWLVISESFRLIEKKSRAYYLFYISWNIVIFVSIFTYTGVVNYVNSNFPFLHLAFSIESILLSLALTYKIKLLQDEKDKQQSLLLQQSRLASMGEMVANIAHQWRQPLTHLSFLFMNIKKRSHDKEIVEQKLKEANNQLIYMSKTIEDFRNFYNPSKKREEFSIKNACQSVLTIISHIKIEINVINDGTFYGNKNEFEQVILNLINNARDAIIQKKIKDPKITIEIDELTIIVSDNAGGIDKKDIASIFEPYFSTKKGSDGIGLYIAKTIIEKEMGGKLEVENSDEGAVFTIVL